MLIYIGEKLVQISFTRKNVVYITTLRSLLAQLFFGLNKQEPNIALNDCNYLYIN